MPLRVTFFLLLFISLAACSSSNPDIEKEKSVVNETTNVSPILQKLEKGILLNPVNIANDASQSYAAYIPSNYDSTKKYPVLFAFDAHAGGRIPVQAYKDLAEKYGYILVGSNNSKNGLDAALLNQLAFSFIADVKARLSIDERRIYLTGFSGGARVAAAVAKQGKVCGLAACSAGFQADGPLAFNYIGFAGSEDFNSNEMIALEHNLAPTNSKHLLILYEGKHEWPSAEIFENAFYWFEFNAMKDELIPSNAAMIKTYKLNQEKKVKSFESEGKAYLAFVEADRTIKNLLGLTDCSSLLTVRNSLERTSEVKARFTERAAIEIRERQLQDYYRQAIQEKDYGWWNKEVDNLIAQSNSKQNSDEEKLFFKRSLSFLSLLSYMASNSMLNQNDLSAAFSYLKLYEKVDPENSEVYYLQAILAAKQQNTKGVLPLLNKAVAAGFTDLERLQNEVIFEAAKKDPAYASLVEFLQRKK